MSHRDKHCGEQDKDKRVLGHPSSQGDMGCPLQGGDTCTVSEKNEGTLGKRIQYREDSKCQGFDGLEEQKGGCWGRGRLGKKREAGVRDGEGSRTSQNMKGCIVWERILAICWQWREATKWCETSSRPVAWDLASWTRVSLVDQVRSGWHRSIWEVEPKGFPDGFDVRGEREECQGRQQGFGPSDKVPSVKVWAMVGRVSVWWLKAVRLGGIT